MDAFRYHETRRFERLADRNREWMTEVATPRTLSVRMRIFGVPKKGTHFMHSYAFVSARKLFLATVFAAFLALTPMASSAQDDDPPAQAGRLSFVSGTVSIQQVGSDDWSQAGPNLPLGPGDRIFTDSDGRAEIQVGQTYLRLGPNTDISIVAESAFEISFGVAQGAVHLHCHGLWQQQQARINTPSGSIGLNQPGELRVDVIPQDSVAIFTDLTGNSLVTGAGDFSQPLGGGQALELSGSNPVSPQWLQPAGFDDLDNWSQRRDRQIYRPAAYRYVSPEIPGADELDANGTWLPGTEYGTIWFPNNVAPDWAPYHNGRWINHAPWGWVWVEDEPWGYAPFHYGRWINFSGRWGWVPGPPASHPVWSPALVAFAGGIHIGGFGISAWFPLGPGEAYKPWYHASPRYIDRVNISNISESPRVHVQNTYVTINKVTNITNVTNVTYINRNMGVTAMRQDDFAAGRRARDARVNVDARQMNNVQVIAQPDVKPAPRVFAGPPPARPVPVSVARPVVIDERGKLISTKPGIQAITPPVKAAPPVRPLPGRIVVAPPPTAKAPLAPVAAPVNAPVRPTGKPGEKGTALPPAAPVAAPVNRPVANPSSNPGSNPRLNPGSTPGTNFGARPVAQPGTPLPGRPSLPPTGKTSQPVAQPDIPATRPGAFTPSRPGTPPAAKPVAQPVAPAPATPVARPTPQPAAPQANRPLTAPAARPPAAQPVAPAAVPPVAKPTAPPAAKPMLPPAAKPVAPPVAKPAPVPAVKPVAPTAPKPAAQPDKKTDKKDTKKDGGK
jgi:hypothetical protein